MWCFSPSRTALDCYARHLTVTGCFKSDRNDYPVAFPDDLLLSRNPPPPSSISAVSSSCPPLLGLAFNHLTLFLWNLGFGKKLQTAKVGGRGEEGQIMATNTTGLLNIVQKDVAAHYFRDLMFSQIWFLCFQNSDCWNGVVSFLCMGLIPSAALPALSHKKSLKCLWEH